VSAFDDAGVEIDLEEGADVHTDSAATAWVGPVEAVPDPP
jgi:hypothetical protein